MSILPNREVRAAGTWQDGRPEREFQAALPRTYPGSLRAWWTVAVFSLAAILAYTDRLILSALVDPMKASLRVDDEAVSLLQGAAFVIFCVCSGLVLGRMVDRMHRLRILFWGSTLWCTGTVACGLAPSFWWLFLARAAVGIGEAALAPAAVSVIADSFDPLRRGTALGVFFFGYTIGAPASIAIGSVTLSWANAGEFARIPALGIMEHWRAVLMLIGLSGLLVPALLLSLREPPRQAATQGVSLIALARHLSGSARELVSTYLAMAALSVGDYAALSWMPTMLERRFALPPAAVGGSFGLITAVAGVLGCLIGGIGSDAAARRSSVRGRLSVCAGAAGLACAGAAFMGSPTEWAGLCGLGIWMFGSTLGAVSGIATIQSLVPSEARGLGIALVAFCNLLLGLGCGPTIVALFTEHVYGNPASVGSAIVATTLPMGVTAAFLFRHARRGNCELMMEAQ